MKWLMILMLVGAMTAQAATVAGPKGGKLLENDAPRAEFFVNADRKVEVRFYDADLRLLAPAEQRVTVIAEAPTGKTQLALVKEGDALVSATPLPEGDGYRIVVRIQSAPEARTQNFRITYHAEQCGGCNLAEYACTCDHAGEDHHGHAH
ncbi:MAG TPA: hypothetical protein PKE12_03450 [Kiritimatiellia bacterium]|nr:hypothetical protein [Kiritimatiellia bacterium]